MNTILSESIVGDGDTERRTDMHRGFRDLETEATMNVNPQLTVRRVVVALVASAALSACMQNSPGDSIAKAEGHIAKRDFGTAIVELKSVLAQNPALGNARYLLGVAFLGQGQAASALTELNKAIELGLDEDRVRGKHAVALIANGRVKQVLSEYEGLKLSDPTAIAEVKTAVAVAHMSANRVDSAEKALDEALEANPKSAWTLINKARIELHKGRGDEAMRLVDLAIERDPASGEAWHFKGALLQVVKGDVDGAANAFRQAAKDGRFTAAATGALAGLFVSTGRVADLRELHKAQLKANPKSPGNSLMEAQIAYMERRFDAAREALDKLLRDRPNDPRLQLFSGAIDLHRGAFQRAETQLGKAVQQPDNANLARRLLAQTYLRMGQPERAYNTLSPLLEAPQSDGELHALAAEASLQLGQLQRAEMLYAEASKRRPNDAQFKAKIAMLRIEKGQTAEAFDSLQKIASTDPSDVADKALISAHLRRGEFDAALAAVDRLAQKKVDPVDVALYKGLIARAKGDAAAARAAFEAVLKLRENHFLSSAQLAELEMKDGQVDAARKRLQAALAANPKDGPARMTYLSFLLAAGAKPEEVRTFLVDAVGALPEEPRLRAALVTQHLRMGDTKSALAAAQQAVAAFPENLEVLDALGRAQSDSGNDEQALSTFNRIASLSTKNALPHIRLADVYGKRRDMVSAARSLRKAFELSPEQREIHVRMLSLAKRTGDPSLPLSAAKDLQRSHPNSVGGYLLEGDAHADKKNWPGAIAAYKGALGKPDPLSIAPIRTYNVWLASGQPAAAERFAGEWLKANPKDGVFLEHVGLRALNAKRYPEAQRLLQQAVVANPRSVAAHNNLALVLVQLGSKAAVESAERAMALAPRSPAVIDTLATALAAQNDVAKALQLQTQAVALSGGQPVYKVNLAKILLQSGDKAKARTEMEAALSADASLAKNEQVVALRKALEAR